MGGSGSSSLSVAAEPVEIFLRVLLRSRAQLELSALEAGVAEIRIDRDHRVEVAELSLQIAFAPRRFTEVAQHAQDDVRLRHRCAELQTGRSEVLHDAERTL